jgi:hypothetical protein
MVLNLPNINRVYLLFYCLGLDVRHGTEFDLSFSQNEYGSETDDMEQSPSVADSRPSSQEIHLILKHPALHYSVTKAHQCTLS